LPGATENGASKIMLDFDIEIDFSHMLPSGNARVATAFLYAGWGTVAVVFIVSGFFQSSLFLRTIHIATGSLFLLALLLFIAMNVMTAGKPGCVLLVVQNVVAMVLGLLATLLFMFGHTVEMLLN
jgi:hypothetical protein